MQLTEATIFLFQSETDGVLLPILSNMAANESRAFRLLCACVCVCGCASLWDACGSEQQIIIKWFGMRVCSWVSECVWSYALYKQQNRQTAQHAYSPPNIDHIWYSTYNHKYVYDMRCSRHNSCGCRSASRTLHNMYVHANEVNRANGKFYTLRIVVIGLFSALLVQYTRDPPNKR